MLPLISTKYVGGGHFCKMKLAYEFGGTASGIKAKAHREELLSLRARHYRQLLATSAALFQPSSKADSQIAISSI